MNKHHVIFGLMTLALATCGERTLAHYLWGRAGEHAGKERVANIYFEGVS